MKTYIDKLGRYCSNLGYYNVITDYFLGWTTSTPFSVIDNSILMLDGGRGGFKTTFQTSLSESNTIS